MKNVFLRGDSKRTKSPGDLVLSKFNELHIFTKNDGIEYGKTTENQKIYIVIEMKVNFGDWYLSSKGVENSSNISPKIEQKILLTNDRKLIKEGIKEIPLYFLVKYIDSYNERKTMEEIAPLFIYELLAPILPLDPRKSALMNTEPLPIAVEKFQFRESVVNKLDSLLKDEPVFRSETVEIGKRATACFSVNASVARDQDRVHFANWLMGYCKLSLDQLFWSYKGKEYNLQGILLIYKEVHGLKS